MNVIAKQVKFPTWNSMFSQILNSKSDKEICFIVSTAIAKHLDSPDPMHLANILDIACDCLIVLDFDFKE